MDKYINKDILNKNLLSEIKYDKDLYFYNIAQNIYNLKLKDIDKELFLKLSYNFDLLYKCLEYYKILFLKTNTHQLSLLSLNSKINLNILECLNCLFTNKDILLDIINQLNKNSLSLLNNIKLNENINIQISNIFNDLKKNLLNIFFKIILNLI